MHDAQSAVRIHAGRVAAFELAFTGGLFTTVALRILWPRLSLVGQALAAPAALGDVAMSMLVVLVFGSLLLPMPRSELLKLIQHYHPVDTH